MEMSTIRDATSCQNPKVQYRIHKSSPPVPILSHTNPVYITLSHLSKSGPNIIHQLPLGFLSGFFPSGSRTNNLYVFLLTPIRATCLSHFILLDLLILIILGEEYKSRSSSLMKLSPLSRHLTPLRSKYPPQYPVLKHPQSMSKTKFAHKGPQAKL
jgi:hypothetical protein